MTRRRTTPRRRRVTVAYDDHPTCATCRRDPAQWWACNGPEGWPICGRCRNQARRHGTGLTYRPLTDFYNLPADTTSTVRELWAS